MQQPSSQSIPQGGSVQDPYWRSLDQLTDPLGFEERHKSEFAEGASEAPVLDDVSRRKFLGVVAASVAMASMTSCRKPVTRILPFGKRPEDMVPGNPTYYATAHVAGGVGTGTLVKSSDGRPTKVEGNPMHPSSLGATNHLMQAELLNLYDPARSEHNTDRDACEHDHGADDHSHDHAHTLLPQTIEQFSAYFAKQVGNLGGDGTGMHLLLEPTTSPSIAAALTRLSAKYPKAQIHYWAPVNRDASNAATTRLYGKALDTRYDLSKADVVVSVECDFQSQDGNAIRNARDFASRRKVTNQADASKIARHYAIESYHSVTGSNSDHRFRIRASEAREVVIALAGELAKLGVNIGGDFSGYADIAKQHKFNGKDWLPILAEDLSKADVVVSVECDFQSQDG
ncbi:MAG: TAT-variant-translocated molybdopterin oxidoreductase, partial [Planctomycetota bacterium]|nr:TAT-variant-translocated molybdopterin oxidoreductase [Planctomycetota bacterium]